MKTLFRALVLASSMLALGLPASAQDATKGGTAAATKEIAVVKALLESRFPGAPISNVSKSPYFGLYEAQLDDRMLYTDAKVNYVLVGSVYDTATRTNLTEARMRKMNRVAWDSLPFNLAMKKVKGDGSRKLAVFADADCPFCKRLETEMQGLDNVTIYTFLFPIDSLHPDSAHKSAQIWCAPDRVQAWDDWFASGKLPDNKGDCPTPIAEVAELGQKYHVNATPTLIFADGSIIPGALQLDRLEAEVNNAEIEAKKMTAQAK
jgi:thiol:disulfide interchange protein DsbC